jgi:hypothetical protein
MINNCFEPLYNQKNKILTKWGKDQTGQIKYKINEQGFRSNFNYDFTPDYAFFGASVVFGIGVEFENIFASQFQNSQNYGLAGSYMNEHSVKNFELFINSNLYKPNTKIVFCWVERDTEYIPDLYNHVQKYNHKNILHISLGQKYKGLCNLISNVDNDISKTHPGPKTHKIWAKCIKLLLNKQTL